MSSPDINYPSTPSYGESLAEALKAQAEFLQGTGDFEETGSLESLLPLEESVRKKTAQTDTDVLRQTLLGTRQEETKGTYDDEGRLVVGYEDGKKATTETKTVTPRVELEVTGTSQQAGTKGIAGTTTNYEVKLYDPDTNELLDTKQTSKTGAHNEEDIKKLFADEVETTITVPPTDSTPIY